MSTFEDLLNDMISDEESSDMKIKLEEDGSVRDMQFADGNAQLRDFFEMIGYICESSMDDLNMQYIPFEQALLYTRDADARLHKNTIAYRVVKRTHTDKMGYKVRNTSTLLSDDEQRSVNRYTEFFTSTVQFSFLSMNYDEAWDMMDRFEETLTCYASHIREAGIVDFWFENQESFIPNIDFRDIMIVFVLNYTVKTERNTVITNENVRNINIVGRVIQGKANNNK